MTWVRLDVGFFRNGKSRSVSKDGRLLYLAGLCHCAEQLTDGRIPKAALPLVAAEADVKPAVAAKLVAAGLWIERRDAYLVRDYLDFNPAAEDQRALRRKRSAAGKRGAEARAATASAEASDAADAPPHAEASDAASAEANGQATNETYERDVRTKSKYIAPPKVSADATNDAEVVDAEVVEPGTLLALAPMARPTRARAPDPIWEALMAACDVDVASVTASARGAYNRSAKSLRDVGATPDDIARRALIFQAHWPGVNVTPTALARRWAECGRLQSRNGDAIRTAAAVAAAYANDPEEEML